MFPQQSYAILEGTRLRDQIFPLGFCVSFEKGDAFAVTDLAITLLCAAGLFLALLEDRFRLWATVACYGAAYLVSLAAGWIVRGLAGPSWAVAAGGLVLFAASLFLSRNNPLQKFFLVLLTLACHFYLEAFLPPVLGLLPVSPAGALGALLSLLALAGLFALVGMCLYRPYRHFSGRGPSAFLWGMCLVLLGLCAVANGRVDFLFRVHVPAERLLAATLVFLVVIFVFRSVYQAGRYCKQAAKDAARAGMLELKAGDFADTLAAVREAKAARKTGEYALDTVNVMLQDGNGDMVPKYTAIFKQNSAKAPIAGQYSENPYINAVIAAKAAFAAQNSISFESNAVTGEAPLSTVELCVLISEMLTRACTDAASFEGERRVRFTAFPGEGSLTLEAVYSGELPQKPGFSWKGQTFSQLLAWLFDEDFQGEDDLHGLENARDIVERYSGKLSLSGAPGEVILHMGLRF